MSRKSTDSAEDFKIPLTSLEDKKGNYLLSSTTECHEFPLPSAMVNGQENPNKAGFQSLDPMDIKPEKNDMNQDIKPAVVPPTFRGFYEFMHELNDSCQINFTPREIIALVNNVDIVPETSEQKSCILDPQLSTTECSLNSIQQGSSGLNGESSKCDAFSQSPPEKKRQRSTTLSSSSRTVRSRCVFVKPKLSRLVIKLTSREYLSFRHYNNAERCIEKLNRCLCIRNLKVLLSPKKSRLTVTGSCDFDALSVILLKLMRLAVHWWDRRNDEKNSKSSSQPPKDAQCYSDKQNLDVEKAQSSDKFSSSANEPTDAAADAGLVANIEAPATAKTSLSSIEIERHIADVDMVNNTPNKSSTKRCLHLCKDFPDCSNTNPDQIISNSSCKVEYIVKPTQHNLFIRADQQLDIVNKLNLRFEGVKITLLRKFAAFHILPAEGVDPQLAINAISELKRGCLSMDDIKKELEKLKKLVANILEVSSTSFVKEFELTLPQKPQADWKRKLSRELCRPLAKKSKMEGRERYCWGRQKQRPLRNRDIAGEPNAAQPFHHYENSPQYGSSNCEGPNPNGDYTNRFDAWQRQHGQPFSQWEPAPMSSQYSIPTSQRHCRQY